MANYRKTLKTRIRLLLVPLLISAVLGVYDVFFAPAEIKDSFVFGYVLGITAGLAFCSIFLMFKYTRALSNETRLKKLYNWENDERLKAIRAKAGIPAIIITSVAILIAGVIASFYSYTVFYTLTAVSVIQLLVANMLKIYYKNRT